MVYQGLNNPSSKVYWFRIPKWLTLRRKNVIILFYLIRLFISGLESRELWLWGTVSLTTWHPLSNKSWY
jgi:hypothetical protein